MSIGQTIYRLRRESQMSQEELATKLGVTRQAISKWELNEVTPDTTNLVALSELFEISVDNLLGRNQSKQPGLESGFDQGFDSMTNKATSLAKKHWAKIGYYLIYTSIPLLIFSFISRAMLGSFTASFFDDDFGDLMIKSPFSGFFNGILIVGLLLLVSGVCLAVYDYVKNKKAKQ